MMTLLTESGQRITTFSLLSLQFLLLAYLGWTMSPMPTEVGHMGATVYWWHTFSYDVFCVNPPLTRMVSGVPVVMSCPNYDWNGYSSRSQDRPEWAIGNAFIAANSPEKVRWCFVLARWSLIPFILVGGYFGWRLSSDIFGGTAGVVFVVLWCFSPLLSAWGATICPDATAAALGLVAVYTLRQWLRRPNWTRAAVAGVFLGLLALTKLTWIIAFVLWPTIWCLWTMPRYWHPTSLKPALRQLAAVLCLGLFTLNTGYLFDGTFRPLGQYSFISQMLHGPEISNNEQSPSSGNRFAGSWLAVIPVPLPADFVQGIDTQRYDFERGLPSYLRGQWANHGWWYYYLYVLAVKVPLGIWCLVALALAVTIVRYRYSASWRDELLVLSPFTVILILVSSQTGFSLHPRYVLPALPFLFVWTSKVARVFEMRPFTRKRMALAATVVLAILWSAGDSLAVYPHSLSYFNELVGGPTNGPKHLLGSNTDWGQDLFCLEDWCQSHPQARLIKVAYFGGYPLDRSKIKSAGIPPSGLDGRQIEEKTNTEMCGPMPGWYALSVNEVYAQSQQYRYFLNFEPVAMAGYSIYIYYITPEAANRVRRNLGLPALKVDRTEGHNGEQHVARREVKG